MRERRHFGIILFGFLASVLAFFLLSAQLSAASPTLNAEVKPSADGKTVTVVFSVQNNPGIAGFRFTTHYENKILKPVNAAMNSKISGGMFVSNLEEATDALNVVWVNGTNYTGNGELCSATFSVIGTLKNGKYPITVTYDPDDLVIIDSSQNPKTAVFEVKGMTASALAVSTQSEQPKPGSSSSTGSQATNSIASSVYSSALSAFPPSASSAETSAPSIGVNSQIRPPDYTGSAPGSSAAQQSSQSASGSQSEPGENTQIVSDETISETSYSPPFQSPGVEIPVQSPNGESPDLLLIAVSVIAAAAVIVLVVLIIKKKKQQ